jgi:glycosyltransferase involved in cell wall biosynthesis
VVEANPRYPATRLAVRWMRQRGRPVVGWGLGAPPLSGRLAGLRRWERLSLLRSLDAVVAYSRRGAEQYRALMVLPPERVVYAANATAARPAVPPPERPPAFAGRPAVLFVGRLQARKRLDNLLRACAMLPEASQPRLVIVGEGPARADFEALARQIYPQAEFVGARHGAELEPFYAAADLFVLPGTGGLAVQQAMAHGLPVMVARGDGTQDDLVRPENGWLVPPDDLGALAETLRLALADPAELRRRGAESYRIVAEEANVEAMAGVFIAVLNGLQ